MGSPKIKISILDPVFEEISTRSIFCKKNEDFSKKTREVLIKKKTFFFLVGTPLGRTPLSIFQMAGFATESHKCRN